MIYLDIVLAQKGLGFIGYFGKSTLDILDTWGQLQIKLENNVLLCAAERFWPEEAFNIALTDIFLRVEVIARSFSCTSWWCPLFQCVRVMSCLW